MTSDNYVVSLKSVMLRYANGVKALRNIDLALGTPSFQCITGTCGAGKTSILKLIDLDIKPTAGSVSLFGVDVKDMSDDEISEAKRNISIVPQGLHLIDSMTVLENVVLPLKIVQIDRKEREQRAMEILDWIGLGKNSHDSPCELSSGERQCVAIARGVVKKPKILLADDPISYLDARMSNKVISLFYELSKLDTCVVIANNNEQKLPALLKEAREIRITSGMLVDNVMGKRVTDELPIAM